MAVIIFADLHTLPQLFWRFNSDGSGVDTLLNYTL